MPTKNVVIDTTAISILACAPDEVIDVSIYNNSANTVYLGDGDVSSTNGYPLPANGGKYENDKRGTPIFLIASGASSDVRIDYEIYKRGSR